MSEGRPAVAAGRGRASRQEEDMVQTCSKCSRANPADAVYCYYDGLVLGGHSRNGVVAPDRRLRTGATFNRSGF